MTAGQGCGFGPGTGLVNGAVYRVTLRLAPLDEPLLNTPYFGQTVRSDIGSPGNLIRWREEANQARRHAPDTGFIALMATYGPDAFEWSELARRSGQERDVQTWADQFEKRLIEDHGGVLRDPCKRMRQTLNLQVGGKGVNFAFYAKAFHEKSVARFVEQLKQYLSEHGDVAVPCNHVLRNGVHLGQRVAQIRYDPEWLPEAERVWVSTLPGWTWRRESSDDAVIALRWDTRRESTALRRQAVLAASSVDKEKLQRRFDNNDRGSRRRAAILKGLAVEDSTIAKRQRARATVEARRQRVLDQCTPVERQKKLKQFEREDRRTQARRGSKQA